MTEIWSNHLHFVFPNSSINSKLMCVKQLPVLIGHLTLSLDWLHNIGLTVSPLKPLDCNGSVDRNNDVKMSVD